MMRQTAIFCWAVALRLAYVVWFHPQIGGTYWALSQSLLETGSLSHNGRLTTDFEPLYPAFLAAARVVARDHAAIVQALQVGIASLGAVLLYRLGLRLSGSTRVATISGCLFALHPLLIRQAGAASDLALATTLLIAFACSFVTIQNLSGAFIAGAWLGVAVLARSMILPVLAGGALVLIADRKFAHAGAFCAAVLVLILPFVIRNHAVNGSWWPTRSGINLFIGNSVYTASLLPDEDLDLLQRVADDKMARGRPELSPSDRRHDAAMDALLTRSASNYMIEHPLATLRQKIVNVVYFLSPRIVPWRVSSDDTQLVLDGAGGVRVVRSAARPRIETLAYAVSTSCMLLAAAVGVAMRRRRLRDDAILWVIFLTFVGVSALYYPATRYTAPILFVLLFYSAVALSASLLPAMKKVT